MIVGKVIGSLISTRKTERLIGSKFMIVEPLESMRSGVGEVVLVATGSAARIACGAKEAPIDAAIVGIVDRECGLG